LAPAALKRHLSGTTRKDKPMTDELLMRRWNATHNEFSTDLSRGLLRLGQYLARRRQTPKAIGKPYAPAIGHAVAGDNQMSATARAALAGVLACVATTALMVSVAALATSGLPQLPAMPAGSPIVAHTVLA
jgi:hypothetical protein